MSRPTPNPALGFDGLHWQTGGSNTMGNFTAEQSNTVLDAFASLWDNKTNVRPVWLPENALWAYTEPNGLKHIYMFNGQRDVEIFSIQNGQTVLPVPKATTDQAGLIEIATAAEANAATDATRAMTPAVSVPKARKITTSGPLTGGGDLSADRTIGIAGASLTTVGAVKLNNAINSTSNTEAATPAAVKAVYEAALAAVILSFNTKRTLTASGTFTAPVTSWYRITCIGGGGGFGWYPIDNVGTKGGGGAGGTTSFGSLVLAFGGSGGSSPSNLTGAGGGGASGDVEIRLIWLQAGQVIPFIIGGGGVNYIGTNKYNKLYGDSLFNPFLGGPPASYGVGGADIRGLAGRSGGNGASRMAFEYTGTGGDNGTGYGWGAGGHGGNTSLPYKQIAGAGAIIVEY